MMAAQETITKMNGYDRYLLFKHIIDRIRESPCTKQQMAVSLGVEVASTSYIIRILVELEIIKVISFDIETTGRKRAVFELIKDE